LFYEFVRESIARSRAVAMVSSLFELLNSSSKSTIPNCLPIESERAEKNGQHATAYLDRRSVDRKGRQHGDSIRSCRFWSPYPEGAKRSSSFSWLDVIPSLVGGKEREKNFKRQLHNSNRCALR
jgi:hypothetical protein